jgi:hypothetical protein
MITTLGKQTNGITSSTANNTANFQSTVNATNGSFKGNCHNCGMPGHIASHCYKSQFDKFIDRNQSRNWNQPMDLRERSNSNDRDQDRNYDRDRYQNRERDREHDKYRDRDRDRSRSRDNSLDRESHYKPQQNKVYYREEHNKKVANATTSETKDELMRQEIEKSKKDPNYQIDTRLFFRQPPEWDEIERREAEDKKNEEERTVRFNTNNNQNPNNNSRKNDNENYDTRPIRDSRRITYSS